MYHSENHPSITTPQHETHPSITSAQHETHPSTTTLQRETRPSAAKAAYLDPTTREITELLGSSFGQGGRNPNSDNLNWSGTDAYVFANGPAVRFGQNWLDLARLVAQNRQLACRIQKYHRLRDGSFRPVFAHPATVLIDFYLFQPSPNPYSGFQAQVTGNVVSICEPDAIAANDPLLAALNPIFDITFDYVIERGIGLFQQLNLTHRWAQRPDALPHLMTSINFDLMRSQVRVIDVTDQLTSVPDHEPPIPGPNRELPAAGAQSVRRSPVPSTAPGRNAALS